MVPNRLVHEASPYLQQHAHNPVDWYPWGQEALDRAKAEDKPILLSIGYSACHWCHVMESESFEDGAIARLMNANFVCIKVDREERPDLDQVYQLVVQLMGRSGGWPLTVFLTPEQKPFFAGTYFPPVDRYGVSGFPTVLCAVTEAYRKRRNDLELQANEITDALGRAFERGNLPGEKQTLSGDVLEKASRKLFARFDDKHGGFGNSPKFPNTMCLDVLLRRSALDGDDRAKERVGKTLFAMRAGGIWDQLGGGFHRYSTDERWLVPHFEKMLYDNALLIRLYTDAFRAFGDDAYAATASDIGTYLLREMQSPAGGFYSAQDADSDGEEGKFFVWTPAEVTAVLSDDPLAAKVAMRYFGITEQGNFESSRATVLAENRPLSTVAAMLEQPLSEVQDALTRATMRMLAAREKRTKPFRDEKIIASWNGLAIGALADAALGLGEWALLAAAEKAFDYVEETLVTRGTVMRLCKGDLVKGTGFLDDYAFLCSAALDIYEATGNEKRLASALELANSLIDRFWDESTKAFFFTPSDGEKLIMRNQDPFDQAIPSGGSVASLVLLKLGALVDERYADIARSYLESIAPQAIANPFAFGQTIGALDRLVRGSVDVVILGETCDRRASLMHQAALGVYLPNRNVVWADPKRPESMHAAPLLTADKPFCGEPVAYVCRGRTCSAPVSTEGELVALLATRA